MRLLSRPGRRRRRCRPCRPLERPANWWMSGAAAGAAAEDGRADPPSPESILREGLVATANFGGYGLSCGMEQLSVTVFGASSIGGVYMLRNVPFGQWFVLTDRHGFLLPVAVMHIRENSCQIRVDPAPLEGGRRARR